MPKTSICILGLIGVGKSTIFSKLKEHYTSKALFVEEPYQINPYLESYYKNPSEYAFKMQDWFLDHKYEDYVKALHNPTELVFSDVSFHFGKSFVDMNRKVGNINIEDYLNYGNKERKYIAKAGVPDIVIYLENEESVIIERIKNRGRACEQEIQLEYLKELHSAHMHTLQYLDLLDKTVKIKNDDIDNCFRSVLAVISQRLSNY